MEISNLPQTALPEWFEQHTHSEQHTFEDILFGVKGIPKKSPSYSREEIISEPGSILFVFFKRDHKKKTLFAIIDRDTFPAPKDSYSFREICSYKHTATAVPNPIFFLPLITGFTVAGLHRFAKLSVFGEYSVGGADVWEIKSYVEEEEHAILGKIHLVSSKI